MIKKIAVSVAMFCLWTSLVFAAVPAWVTVHDTGVVWGEDILLGSIADISCSDEQRRQKLINMKLGIINKPGSQKIFSEYVLKMQIQSSGVDSSDITWSMPDSITVTRASQTVTSEQMANVAREKLEQTVKQSGEQRKRNFELLAVPPDMLVPPGELSFDVQIPYGIKYTVPTTVYIYFNVKGKPAGRALCRFQMHTFENVIVAARAIRANEILTADDLRIESKEVGAVNAGYMVEMDKAVGRMPRYPLKPGDMLKDSLLTKPVIIKRGAPVRIVVKKNGLAVQAEGIALADGREGVYIRVKNSATGVIVSGRVIDEETVEVQ